MNLFLIPSPLAPDTDHLISPMVLEVIQNTKHYFVENERHARRFIGSLSLNISVRDLHFFELTKNTSSQQLKSYFDKVSSQNDVGIISEAGCPGIADPGALAIQYAHQHKISVIPIPGASSIFLALMGSGFNGQSFTFHGYLPIDKGERAKRIKNLDMTVTKTAYTQIFMETPYRNNNLLEDILKFCAPNRLLCIAANLTGKNELIQTKSVKEWKNSKLNLHKQPTIFLLGV